MAVLEVRDLAVGFRTAGGVVRAVSEASFSVERGEVLVIVSESGSGKTVLAHAFMRLLPMNVDMQGSVILEGASILDLPERDMQRIRGRRMSLIPQGPGSALNPVRRVGNLMLEMARARGLGQQEARARLGAILADLGLDYEKVARMYPHQLSGGMQQRVVNAMAMVGAPAVVIADEPTPGLDPSLVDVTAEQLRQVTERGAALLVITHDLRLAERLGGRIALLYASYIFELRDTAAFFAGPAHPYGQGLLGALPERGSKAIPGISPELTVLPPACTFGPRCQHRRAACDAEVPAMRAVSGGGHVRCVLHD